MASETQVLFGSAKGKNKNPISVQTTEDPYKDSTFFAPNMEEDSKHMTAFPKGSSVVGIFDGVRVANKDKAPSEQYKYVCLKTEAGEKCRLKAMGNLPWILEESGRIERGMTIEIVYEGKLSNDKFPKGVHTFSVFEITN